MTQEQTPAEPAASTPSLNAAPQVDFTTLVLSLQESALLLLGLKEDDGHGVGKDIAGAKVQIDLLAMLQEKTDGNLTEDEERLLRTVLYDLRVAYVDARKAS